MSRSTESREDSKPARWRPLGMSPWGLRTAAGTLVLSGATFISNLAITLILTHLVGATGYGVYAFAIAAAGLLAIPAVGGLTPLIIRNIAAYRVRESWGELHGLLRRANQAVLLSSLFIVAVAAALGLVLRQSRPTVVDAYWLALPLVPLIAFASVRQAALQAFDRVLLARIPETILQPLVFLGLLGIVAAVGDPSGTNAVALLVTATSTAVVVGWIVLHRTLPSIVRQTAPVFRTRVWAKGALSLVLLSGVYALNEQVDIILIGTIKGPRLAGIFSVADRVSLFVSFFVVAVTYPLSPLIARLWETKATPEIQRIVTRSTRVVFAGSLAIAVALIVFAEPVLRFFGPSFASGRTAMIILCVGQLVNTGTGPVAMVLMMIGHESEVTRSVLAGVVVSVALNAVLVPSFDLVGAAIATSLGVMVTNLMLLIRLWRRTGIWAAFFGHPGNG